jgi:chaperone modulatory protein CbpM
MTSEAQLYLSRVELAAAAGVSSTTLARLIRIGLVEPAAPGASLYTAECASRLRRMWRLHVDLGVNLVGAAIVVDLLERLERLEADLARLRAGHQ